MKKLLRYFVVFAVLLAVAGCKTYDQSFDWMEGSSIEGVAITVNGVSRGILEFSLTNNSSEDQQVVILPRSTIIGYRMYLDRNTNKARTPGQFKGEPRIVRPIGGSQISDEGQPNIYGSFNLSYNDITVPPGETVYTQLYLRNWDRATENFIALIHFLVREGEVRNRIVMEIPAQTFFNNSVSVEGSASMLKASQPLRTGK
ncbi:MAG: hypothetical protein PQJ58_13085 [Spirochaetales bacterium]|nr:hypothetical protein [Spirochaetales bacterium]